jgi:hypothetical protein
VTALREMVATLHARGYRVVLFLPASHAGYLALLDATPGNAAAEAEFRARVLSPAATGADTVLALRDAAELGTTDSVFYDYGHLTRGGATLQTRALAGFLVRTGMVR